MCRRGSTREAGVLHCPAEHAEEVCRIYQQLEVVCQIDTKKQQPCLKKTVVSWRNENIHHSCILTIHKAGKDFPDILCNRMEQIKCWKDATLLCYLNIKYPAAIFAYKQLLQAGFFFTGLKPLQAREEYMLMAYTGRQIIRY